MTTKLYSLQIVRSALFLFILFFSQSIFSQTAPENTRLFQLNTIKGSRLTLVESTDNNVYHVGTVNNSEVGFDGLAASNVGLDDLFILKSNSATGSNTWFKTFDAGVKGTIIPRYTYVDSSENIYVFAQFKGSVTVGNKTISSINATDTFLMKIDQNGNAVWVHYIENGYNSLYKTKCLTDGLDAYLVYGGNHLLKLNDTDGSVIYNNLYNNVELKSVAVKDQNLYLAGAMTTSGAVLGSEIFTDSFVGFIVKGDKDANFTSSLRTAQAGSFQTFSDVSDIAISTDGFLLLTGFYTRSSINLQTEAGAFSFTYNPNDNYDDFSRLYNYVAKVDHDLASVSFFRTSTPVNRESIYNIRTDYNFSKLIPYGNSGDFRQINYIINRLTSNIITSYTNANGTTTTVPTSPESQSYTSLLSNNNLGSFKAGSQVTQIGFRMSASGSGYTLTDNTNTRIFTTSDYNADNGNLLWTKQKASSIGGSFSKQFQKHLKSAKSDVFFTTLAEGKGQFFSREFDLGQNAFSRFITRLGADGTTKWIANFSNANNSDELNISQDFACTDNDDNFYFLASVKGSASVFSDSEGNVSNFTTAGGNSKALVKLDRNGKLLWSKQINQSDISKMAVATDSAGNVYLVGQTVGSLELGTFNIPSAGGYSVFVIKFSNAGNLMYSKYYKNIGYGMFSLNPVFDSQNNLYVFAEPSNASQGNMPNYIFDSVTIPSSINGLDHLMIKFDSSGNVIFGKNFYANAPEGDISYAWPNNVKFDGTNFVILGNYFGDANTSRYLGLDLIDIPKTYSTPNSYVPFFAKVSTSGNVLWQKSLESNNNNTGGYTNFEIDESKNIYMYYSVKDKMTFSAIEYSFDAIDGNKVLLKLNTNGNLIYYKTTDKGMLSYPLIDVIENDKINVTGYTSENSFLNYKINNQNASNLYIATFGALDEKYLTPTSNYLVLTNAALSNIPGNNNSFVFELINNVNWTAISDQNWLSLSASQMKSIANTVSGTGDNKITLVAETNNSQVDRSANVLITGDSGVASKTVVVTQTAVLANQEAKTFVTVIYPNPTSDILNIQTEQKISKIEILDTSGKLVKSNSGSGKTINVFNLSKGIYLIKIYSDKNIINSKFIKN